MIVCVDKIQYREKDILKYSQILSREQLENNLASAMKISNSYSWTKEFHSRNLPFGYIAQGSKDIYMYNDNHYGVSNHAK